jgi:DNA topoisomerase-3
VPTPKAFSLMFALHMLHIVELGSPELTGEWEHKLKLIEAGKMTREEFMAQIGALVKTVVNTIKHGEIPDVVYATVPAPCPKCGGKVQENYRKVQCQKCEFTLWRVISGREWSPEELAELFTKRFVGPLTGFRSKQGRPFSAGIRLTDDLRLEFDFGQGAGGEGEAAPDFSGQQPLGKCPKCGASVFEHGVAYVCEKAVGPERKCDFRSGRLILQQPIERSQMEKLLETGRTDLLTGFVSKKNRKFKAFLVKQPDGKIGFEFQPRKEKVEKPSEEKPIRRGSERRARSTR